MLLKPDAEPARGWLGTVFEDALTPDEASERSRKGWETRRHGKSPDMPASGPVATPKPSYVKDSSQVSDRYHEWRTRHERANAELGRNEWTDPAPTYLTGADTPETREAALRHPGLGLLITPWTAHYADRTVPYSHIAVDNGVYTEFTSKGQKPFSREKFLGLLDRLRKNPEAAQKVLFAVAPDKVGDWRATVERSAPYYEEIHARGFPAAFSAQDGIEQNMDQIPWDDFEVLFIGGSTAWKLGYDTTGLTDKQRDNPTPKSMRGVPLNTGFIELLKEAKRRGKRIHVGRVSSTTRFDLSAYGLGSDTMDGTFILFGSRENTPKVLEWLDGYDPYKLDAREHPAQERMPGDKDEADVAPSSGWKGDTTPGENFPPREPEPPADGVAPRVRIQQQLADAIRPHLGGRDDLLPTLVKSSNGWAAVGRAKDAGLSEDQQVAIKAAWDDVWKQHRESVTGVKEPVKPPYPTDDAGKEKLWKEQEAKDKAEREEEALRLRNFGETHWKNPPPMFEVSAKEWAACQFRAQLAQVERDLPKLREVADLERQIIDHDSFSDDPWPREQLQPLRDRFDALNEKKSMITLRNRYRDYTEKGRVPIREAMRAAEGQFSWLQDRMRMGYYTLSQNNRKFDPIREHAEAVKAAVESGQQMPDAVIDQYQYEAWMPQKYKDQLLGFEWKKNWKEHLQSGLRQFQRQELSQALAVAQPKLDAVLKAPEGHLRAERMADQERVNVAMDQRDAARKALEDEVERVRAITGSELWTEDDHPEEAKRQSELWADLMAKGEALKVAEQAQQQNLERLGREFLEQVLPAEGARVKIVKSDHLDDDGRESVDKAARWLSRVVGVAHGELTVKTAPIEDNSGKGKHRAYANSDVMHIRPDESTHTVIHEFGHNLDHLVGLDRFSKAFAVEALVKSGQDIEHFGHGYDPDEFGNEDKFWGPSAKYCGKYYAGQSASEVLSMGLQYLYQDPIGFHDGAPEHFRYTLAAIHGFI